MYFTPYILGALYILAALLFLLYLVVVLIVWHGGVSIWRALIAPPVLLLLALMGANVQ